MTVTSDLYEQFKDRKSWVEAHHAEIITDANNDDPDAEAVITTYQLCVALFEGAAAALFVAAVDKYRSKNHERFKTTD